VTCSDFEVTKPGEFAESNERETAAKGEFANDSKGNRQDERRDADAEAIATVDLWGGSQTKGDNGIGARTEDPVDPRSPPRTPFTL